MKHKPIHKPMWNAKVKCVDVLSIDRMGFKVGEIYEVIDSKLILPDGSKTYGDYNDIETINENFYAAFEEVET